MNLYCGSLWTRAVVHRGHELWFATTTRTAADRGLLAEFAGHIVFFKLYYNAHIDILAAFFFFFFQFLGKGQVILAMVNARALESTKAFLRNRNRLTRLRGYSFFRCIDTA